jgi:hypothetical protein
MKTYTIRKPTHKFLDRSGAVLALGQKRGDRLALNVLNENGDVTRFSDAIGLCADHLTGGGEGVGSHESLSVDSMQRAWRFTFGVDVDVPYTCAPV